jgi:ABC-type tungstate transport system permease subunit
MTGMDPVVEARGAGLAEVLEVASESLLRALGDDPTHIDYTGPTGTAHACKVQAGGAVTGSVHRTVPT